MRLPIILIILSSINIFIWCILSGVIGRFLVFPLVMSNDAISPMASAVYLIGFSFFSGCLSAPTAITNTRKEYFKKRIKLSSGELEEGKKLAPPGNRWISSLIGNMIFWIPFSLITLVICNAGYPDGMPKSMFTLFATGIVGLNAGLVSFYVSRRETLKYAAHPQVEAQEFKPYLWKEYIAPNAAANVIINVGIAYIIYRPGGPMVPTGLAPLSFFAIDLLITAVIIASLVFFDPWGHAIADVRMGIARTPRTNSFYPLNIKNRVVNLIVNFDIRWLVITLMCLAITGAVAVIMHVLGINEISLVPAMTAKGIIAGIFAGIAAGFSAYYGGVEIKKELAAGK